MKRQGGKKLYVYINAINISPLTVKGVKELKPSQTLGIGKKNHLSISWEHKCTIIGS